ncbi:unnamed protein product, partial [Cyprideis torosa]
VTFICTKTCFAKIIVFTFSGIRTPTPVQINCIPPALKGKDVVGCAKTGSGKTLAFAAPILQQLAQDPFGVFALILTPTRELAIQILDQFNVLGAAINAQVSLIVGGRDMVTQGAELSRRPHVVIATPGRLADHLANTGEAHALKRVQFLVLDEADRLMNGQFDEQLHSIVSCLPSSRQNLFFSATLPPEDSLRKLIMLRDPVFSWRDPEIDLGQATVMSLEQQYLLCPPQVKDSAVVLLLDKIKQEKSHPSVLIFSHTC